MNSQLNGVHLHFLIVQTVLVLLYCFMTRTIAVVEVHNINTDRSSLLGFKDHITYDPNNFLSKNWSVETTICNWFGVTCSSSHLRVTSLNLSSMGLVGTIPPQIGNLSFLRKLDLSNNTFHGSLPSEMSWLRRIKLIRLNLNEISGEIPSWFVFLPKLERLGLRYNNFTGRITHSIFNITSLQELILSHNKFWGLLPSNFFNSPTLQVVSVYGNQFSGPIPTPMSNISSLRVVDLGRNNLSGEVPETVFHHLPKLEWFSLEENDFFGEIPAGLFDCKQLQHLSLFDNRFKGNIPREIGNLTMLNSLYLGSNNLQGTIPPEIFNISSIMIIGLGKNQLSGSLPSTLGSMAPNLHELHLFENHLIGKIPSSLSNASFLTVLNLANNSFFGYIPDIFSSLRKLKLLGLGINNLTSDPSNTELSILSSLTSSKDLRRVFLSANPLNSTLPMSIGNLSSSLEELKIGYCGITGSIPASIGNLSGLISLHLGGNQFIGTIPTEIGSLQGIQAFSVNGNLLEGQLPRVVCQLKRLWSLDLGSNRYFGPIPTCFGNLTSLRFIYLDDNRITSTVPFDLLSLTYLLSLNLSSNKLVGPLPPEIGNLRVLGELRLSNNQLSGNIPSSIGGLQDLSFLDMQQNKFEGPIPESFSSLMSLEELYLSKNNLSGVIPKSLERLMYLRIFNVSFNKLVGEIPSGGPFKNFSFQSFMGNEGLCGAPYLQVQTCKTTEPSKSPKATGILLKFVLPLGVATMLILILLYVLRPKHNKPSNPGEHSSMAILRRISYHELQLATNKFSEVNLVGTGGFGKVYKGILADGMNVAIKVFNLEVEGGFRSFDSECEIFRNVRHRNLTKIIGSCSSGSDFKALVFAYMPNGSLERWLYSGNHPLSIIERLNIMIEVATALDYLHHNCSIPIVHCDLKPQNVLLDQDMVAHVTDFGIAKLMGGNSMTHTMTLATMGYMAPEYGWQGIISRQGDVYSYGIMLMEIFTGKKPTDEMFHGEFSIKHWVKESYPDAIIDIIGAQLMTEDRRQLAAKKDYLLSIMRLAMECSADSPHERRNMKDVLAALTKIKIKLSQTMSPIASVLSLKP